jgi:hypothetical protein
MTSASLGPHVTKPHVIVIVYMSATRLTIRTRTFQQNFIRDGIGFGTLRMRTPPEPHIARCID